MAGAKLREAYQSGIVSLNAMERRVSIRWTASELTNLPPDFSLEWDVQNNALGGAKATSGGQTFSTNYYPSACGPIDSDGMLIGVITSVGGIIVQRWEFTWPETMPIPVVDPATGLSVVAVALPTLERTTVYSEPRDGPHRFVAGICGLRIVGTRPQKALIQFHEPNDICVLDLNSGNLSLVASETDDTGSLGLLPALSAKDYSGIAVREHVSQEYVYRFARTRTDGHRDTAPSVPIILIVDNDRDGIVDVVHQLTGDDFLAQGWYDLQNYIDWWLD